MAKLQKGDAARLVIPDPEGVIIDKKFNEDTGVPRYLFEFTDAAGETQQRWFDEGQLEAVS